MRRAGTRGTSSGIGSSSLAGRRGFHSFPAQLPASAGRHLSAVLRESDQDALLRLDTFFLSRLFFICDFAYVIFRRESDVEREGVDGGDRGDATLISRRECSLGSDETE